MPSVKQLQEWRKAIEKKGSDAIDFSQEDLLSILSAAIEREERREMDAKIKRLEKDYLGTALDDPDAPAKDLRALADDVLNGERAEDMDDDERLALRYFASGKAACDIADDVCGGDATEEKAREALEEEDLDEDEEYALKVFVGDEDDIGPDEARRICEQYYEPTTYGSSVTKVVSLTLAGGGPSADLEFEIDEDGDMTAACFVFKDWGVCERRELPPATAERLWEKFSYMAESEPSHGQWMGY